jgi:hypothetical protein
MAAIQPTNNTGLIVDEFIRYATIHLTTVSGMANTVSLYPPLSTPAPGIVLWTGYTVPPAAPSPQIPAQQQIDDIKKLYDKLDWSKIPLDKESPEVQDIINPSIEKNSFKMEITTTAIASCIENLGEIFSLSKISNKKYPITKTAINNEEFIRTTLKYFGCKGVNCTSSYRGSCLVSITSLVNSSIN